MSPVSFYVLSSSSDYSCGMGKVPVVLAVLSKSCRTVPFICSQFWRDLWRISEKAVFSVIWELLVASVTYPDPHSHESDNLDPDPHNFVDEKLKCMEYEPIWALFQGLEAFIWKLWSGSGSASKWKVVSGSAWKWQVGSGSASVHADPQHCGI